MVGIPQLPLLLADSPLALEVANIRLMLRPLEPDA